MTHYHRFGRWLYWRDNEWKYRVRSCRCGANEKEVMKKEPKAEYTEKLPDYGDLMTIKDFRDACSVGALIDYDGTGYPVKDGKMARNVNVLPSKRNRIPKSATHVMWFNK
jgi:hypothetical protein